MVKTAFVFPGQGSQFVGMGKDFYDHVPSALELMEEANNILGYDLADICFNGPELSLKMTENTQPVMLAAGYATFKILSEEITLSPVSMAGHSLGEYTALVASNSLDFFDAIKLVNKRGEVMQSAVPNGTGSMAAILGLEDDLIIEECKKASAKGVVEAVNFNSSGQVVIAGEKEAVAYACELLKDAGAKRALILPVSVPSHCSLMQEAANEFKNSIENIEFRMNDVKVIHNVDADYSNNIEEIKSKLVEQIYKPVHWTSSVLKMKESGVDKLIEAGPGKVLAGLTRRIDKSLSASAIIDMSSLKSIIEEISNA